MTEKNNRGGLIKLWRDIHAYLSMFFLPVAIMIAITGALYIFGLTGDLRTETYKIELSKSLPRPLAENIEAQAQVMVDYAKANGIPVPEGSATKGRSGVILGSPTGYHFIFIPERGENTATLQVNNPGIHFKMVMLHKAKCGVPFKVLEVAFAITMILLYLSGIGLFWRNREMRNKLLLTSLIGLIAVVVIAYLSL